MTETQRAAIIDAALVAYGEDYQAMAGLFHIMRAADSGDWIGVLRERASVYEPFADAGLSIEWWISTVDELSRSSNDG